MRCPNCGGASKPRPKSPLSIHRSSCCARSTVQGCVAPMVLIHFTTIVSLSASMASKSRACRTKSSVLTAAKYFCGSPASFISVRKATPRSEEHTSELQSHLNLVCRLLLEKKKQTCFGRNSREAAQDPPAQLHN